MSGPWLVYVNWGRWVADCPRPCGSAVEIVPGATSAVCEGTGACGYTAAVEWPTDAAQITAALARRPVPRTRNWFPRDHPLAVSAGLPHGQMVGDLDAETERGVGAEIVPADETRKGVDRVLAEFGLAVTEDGRTLRRL